MTPTIAGLVLAAGAGNRLGTPKAALPWAGRTLLDHAVTRLRDGGCDPVHAVIGAAADRIRTATTVPVHFVHNPHWPDGMGGSLRAGLRALPGTADAVVVILVDQPGLTAEAVAQQFNVSREDQDQFSLQSHLKALKAQAEGKFDQQIVPITVEQTFVNEKGKKETTSYVITKDEGPRAGTNLDALAKLRPVFAANGSVTAGNSSQMSDGAAFVVVMSEEMVKELNLEPIARLVTFASAGVEPRIMGIGPVKAIPKALKQAGLHQNDIELIELNEAFAAQSLAVIRELDLNPDLVNVNGGAIALGHPLGCTGAKLSVQLFDEMKRRGNKYGMVTMCVGTGQGTAGIYELM